MPVIPAALSALIEIDIDSEMAKAYNGVHPLAQKDPSYFIAMCTAIGTGIALGGPVISFTTSDSGVMGAPPVPGVGTGVGIVVDSDFFIKDLYTRIRGYIIADFGKTSHDAYPPGAKNSGQYLLAMCTGIGKAIKTNFATAWILTSAHPLIYIGSGTISNGNFFGITAPAIKSAIVAAGPLMKGPFWPRTAQAISESYVEMITQHSTGSVTIVGICVPSLVQVCGIGSSGVGTGAAA